MTPKAPFSKTPFYPFVRLNRPWDCAVAPVRPHTDGSLFCIERIAAKVCQNAEHHGWIAPSGGVLIQNLDLNIIEAVFERIAGIYGTRGGMGLRRFVLPPLVAWKGRFACRKKFFNFTHFARSYIQTATAAALTRGFLPDCPLVHSLCF
jgi:hypothetical protein